MVAGAFAIVAFHAIALQRGAWQAGGEELQAALKASSLRAVEDDLSTSFQMVVFKAGASQTDPQKKAAEIALKLAEWENFEEEKYARQRISVDAWIGVISQQEKSALAVKMLEEKKVLKCASCVDFASFSAKGQSAHESEVRQMAQAIASAKNSTEVFGSFGAGWSVYLQNEGLASVSTQGDYK